MQETISDGWLRHLDTDTKTCEEEATTQALKLPRLVILAHADPGRIGEEVWLSQYDAGKVVKLSRLEPEFQAPAGGPLRPLAEPRISRRPILLSPTAEGFLITNGSSRTRIEVNGEALAGSRLLSKTDLDRGIGLLLGKRVALHLKNSSPAIDRPPKFGLVGESSAIVELRRQIDTVEALNLPVLLRGESGTGKELVAQAIAGRGPRNHPYLAVNMAAIPHSLAASELFGAAKGAFSGADQQRQGFFQRADGGTLFLDEVGETPPEVQALLLRVLENGETQPVGGTAGAKVDVRVIAATDANLEKLVTEGDFKEPLWHRLRSLEIVVPPLRERKDDLGLLFFHFLRKELETLGESQRLANHGPYGRSYVPAALLATMCSYHWPGNVRELRNCTRQMAVASRGEDRLKIEAWLDSVKGSPPVRDAAADPDSAWEAARSSPTFEEEKPAAGDRYRDPSSIDSAELIAVLEKQRWNLAATASRLGISRGSLYLLVERNPAIRKASDLNHRQIDDAISRVGKDIDCLAAELRVSKQGLKRRLNQLGERNDEPSQH